MSGIISNKYSHVNTFHKNNRTNILNICLLFRSLYVMIDMEQIYLCLSMAGTF